MFINNRLNLVGPNKQQGVSMLEVLVTILVLSFGLLGMAGLVTTGMKSNSTAHYRSIAVQQTHDIADRMRANLAGVRIGSYDALTTAIPASNDCVAAECDAAQVAAYDHAQWNTANSVLLPNGVGTVTGNLVNGFVIAVMWAEKEMGGGADPGCPGGTPAGTRCFLTRVSP
ncbi:type IV pilus assembly protein PilV [Nitrosomonas aestuarii]|uniref:Type IV pilus assembly protein PilV n=1 Tax=Nitrosomonas aestuarii TaxID=52441 RepID=A0A1I4FAD1_9PROT|nr:type IV pilus modification protein PilV [Nitrosomonas aestuarii]SFL13766.1 type IV pilus assembly protein PilV [Nitrosomonas aestuarii]